MREEILDIFIKSKESYNEILRDLRERLPENILKSCTENIEIEIPRFANNYIHFLNLAEKQQVYSENNNIDELIELFSRPEIQESIDKAMEDNVIGFQTTGGNVTSKEALEGALYGIKAGYGQFQNVLMFKAMPK